LKLSLTRSSASISGRWPIAKPTLRSSQRTRLGEGLDDQEIVMARDERHGALGAEIDISLVDHHQLVRMFGR